MFTDEQELEIVAYYEQVERARIVAERFGTTDETIRRILREHGVKLTHRHDAEIVEMFGSGKSVQEIIEQLGISESTVRKVLQCAGLLKKTKTMRRAEVDVELATSLYESGKTLSEVGEYFGTSYQTIRRKLAGNGVKIRKAGPPHIFMSDEALRRKHKRDKKRRDAISGRVHDGPIRGLKWQDVAKRDHMRCKICGCKVDPTDRWTDKNGHHCFGRRYPTIDHIVALENGGTDTYDNVQLACKRCNSSKQAKGQLKLFT